jgi:AcrR family transcriptional regulator
MPDTLTQSLPDSDQYSSLENTRQRIIRAAAEVFTENGYARTTTRSLATAAGITEVTLFRHFGSKENLFKEVVERFGGRTLSSEFEAQFTGDYRSDLHNLGQEFIRVAMQRSKIMRLMFFEADHFPELASALASNPRQFRKMLSHYLNTQIECGVIKPINTEAAAQAFWSMILGYSLIVDTLKEAIPDNMSPEEAVTQFVNIFIDGTIHKE